MFEICPSPGRGLLTVHYVLKDAGVRKRLNSSPQLYQN